MFASILAMLALMTTSATTRQSVDKPECMLRNFSQRDLGYGNLERKAGNDGRLTFKVEPTEVLHIFFRIHPRK
jgi:hypothetical protein